MMMALEKLASDEQKQTFVWTRSISDRLGTVPTVLKPSLPVALFLFNSSL